MLKIIRLAIDTVKVLRRFSFARQALQAPEKGPLGPPYPFPAEFIGNNLVRLFPGLPLPSGKVLARTFICDGGSLPTLDQAALNVTRFGRFFLHFAEHDHDCWAFDGETFESALAKLKANLLRDGCDPAVADWIEQGIREGGPSHFGPESYPGESNDPKSPSFTGSN